LRTVAFSSLSQLGDEDAQAEAKDIRFLAQAIKDLASADKISVDRELRIRQETAKQAAEKAGEVARRGGLSKDAVQELRREILGV
ncbi:phage protein Gp27 family protein, partial [Shigella sonnei]|uniref:phage protein Gp27 family protein n=1 Tax=Shigella sonnei TaxID=624 RepID=UPI0014942189|nr:DUF3486 family protein [Shigella sonnei]